MLVCFMLADSEINSTECFCSLMRICSWTAGKFLTWGELVLLLQTYGAAFLLNFFLTKCPSFQRKCGMMVLDCFIRISLLDDLECHYSPHWCSKLMCEWSCMHNPFAYASKHNFKLHIYFLSLYFINCRS